MAEIWLFYFRLIGDEPMQCHCSCHIGRQGYLVYAYSRDTPLTVNWHSSGLCHIGRQRYLVYAYSRDTPLAFKWHFSGTKKWRAENSVFWLVRRPSENFQRGYPFEIPKKWRFLKNFLLWLWKKFRNCSTFVAIFKVLKICEKKTLILTWIHSE